MKPAALLALAFAFTLPLSACDETPVVVAVTGAEAPAPMGPEIAEAEFASERQSPLVRSGVIVPGETTFAGEARIGGRFEVVRTPGMEDGPDYYRVLLIPDETSQQILPHAVDDGPVREMWLRNTDAALAMLLTPAQRETLAAGGATGFGGDVIVRIDEYRTGVDCDVRGYNARLIGVEVGSGEVAALPEPVDADGGC